MNNFQKGDVIRICRGIYFHYGVYAGNDRVVHFSAPQGQNELNPLAADICEVSLAEFAQGGEPQVDNRFPPQFSPDEIVERARFMIGSQKGRYNLVGNNCEHFANWCKTGKTRSHQSEVVGDTLSNPYNPTLVEVLGKVVKTFEEVRSDYGQITYDRLWQGNDRRTGTVGTVVAQGQKVLEGYKSLMSTLKDYRRH